MKKTFKEMLQDLNDEQFNPTLKEFLECNPKLTILGLAWSGFWRWLLIIFIGSFIIGGFVSSCQAFIDFISGILK